MLSGAFEDSQVHRSDLLRTSTDKIVDTSRTRERLKLQVLGAKVLISLRDHGILCPKDENRSTGVLSSRDDDNGTQK